MKFILTFTFVLLLTALHAQTKEIAFKSHSGSKANYKAYLANSFFDSEYSNFGMAPARTIRSAVLDSVIYISDTTSIMVTSFYCSYRASEDSTLWKGGKDTMIKHPLFTKKHALDSIRLVLKEQYYFNNNMDSVKFIGYDNNNETRPQSEKKKKNKSTFVPIAQDRNDHGNPPFNVQLIVAIAMLTVLSVFAGILFRKPLQGN